MLESDHDHDNYRVDVFQTTRLRILKSSEMVDEELYSRPLLVYGEEGMRAIAGSRCAVQEYEALISTTLNPHLLPGSRESVCGPRPYLPPRAR